MNSNLVYIFPGQGSQNFGMGLEFYNNFQCAKDLLELASDELCIDFKKVMFEENDLLALSEYTQPAILLNSLMALSVFNQEYSSKPIFTLGHSLGEFSALACSKAFKYLDAIKSVRMRGKFMQANCDGKNYSMMVVLGLSDNVLESICSEFQKKQKNVFVANYNCDGQVVLAGSKVDLLEIETPIKEAGAKRAMLLNMSVASHCPLLIDASNNLAQYLKDVDISENFMPVISNVTAKPYSCKSEALKLLKEQLIKPVLYKQSISNIENEVDAFIEFGSEVLKGINRKITSKSTFSITNIKNLKESIQGLEKL